MKLKEPRILIQVAMKKLSSQPCIGNVITIENEVLVQNHSVQQQGTVECLMSKLRWTRLISTMRLSWYRSLKTKRKCFRRLMSIMKIRKLLTLSWKRMHSQYQQKEQMQQFVHPSVFHNEVRLNLIQMKVYNIKIKLPRSNSQGIQSPQHPDFQVKKASQV